MLFLNLQFIWADFGDHHIYLGEFVLHFYMHSWIDSVLTVDWQHAGTLYMLPLLLVSDSCNPSCCRNHSKIV